MLFKRHLMRCVPKLTLRDRRRIPVNKTFRARDFMEEVEEKGRELAQSKPLF